MRDEYDRAKAARDAEDAKMIRIEETNRVALRAAVEAVLAQHQGRPGVDALIEVYRLVRDPPRYNFEQLRHR